MGLSRCCPCGDPRPDNQSETLDAITESIRKLRQNQQALIADKSADAQWTDVPSNASSSTPTLSTVLTTPKKDDQKAGTNAQDGGKDRNDGKAKRAAVAKAGEHKPQQKTQNT